MQRVLFVLSRLPRQTVSLQGMYRGTEALSGTVASSLFIANGLAQRGHGIGLWIRNGGGLTDVAPPMRNFSDKNSALDWVEDGRIVLCGWQRAAISELASRAIVPWVWTQLPVSEYELQMVESRVINGLVVVSDTVRLPLLHSIGRWRIGRAYNPVNPFFNGYSTADTGRYQSNQVVFAGYIGKSKGVHRLLQMWPYVRETAPCARLVLAGSHKLYDTSREVGHFGVADPSFESEYIAPIVKRFGSLVSAGIHPVGLQTVAGLRALYASSAIGVVNPNWDTYTETFCCAAVEMLASGLPVFSTAAGALPEVIGESGGAVLFGSPDIGRAGRTLGDLLNNPRSLERLGVSGQRYVASHYDLVNTLNHWEELLSTPVDRLHCVGGTWRGPRGVRYWLEVGACALGAGGMLRRSIGFAKRLLSHSSETVHGR